MYDYCTAVALYGTAGIWIYLKCQNKVVLKSFIVVNAKIRYG